MFGPPGHVYVYLIYGMHYCFNMVCRALGRGEAVLVRALAPCWEVEGMCSRRGDVPPAQVANGPAKLCQALAMDRTLDGVDGCDPDGPVRWVRHPRRSEILRQWGPMSRGSRIGVAKAAAMPLRFFLAGSRDVSGARRTA
jgi:DNA-3-methyladenine glycosylase